MWVVIWLVVAKSILEQYGLSNHYFNIIYPECQFDRVRYDARIDPIYPCRGIHIYPHSLTQIKHVLERMEGTELNTLVIALKTETGHVLYDTEVELAHKIGAVTCQIPIDKVIDMCHDAGVRLVVRLVVFKDHKLAKYQSGKYAIRQRDGTIWLENGRTAWVDPYAEEAWRYVIDLAKELATKGVDEIQFDYIRFPSTGGLVFTHRTNKYKNRFEVIAGFLRAAYEQLKPLGVTISVDIYGYVTWYDLPLEGQSLRYMAPYVDVFYPMLYPSHFNRKHFAYLGSYERAYRLVYESIKLGKQRLGENRFIPYIQGFEWRAPGFGPYYIKRQIDAARDAGAWGYLVWNASNDYEPLWAIVE